MAFEKAKVLKAAEKFLSQGKINAAIKEYRQIVDNDADDLTTLNMLGDLYARAGKKEDAVACFERIAEHYCAQEFNLKAIAMYKKIERLKQRDPIIAHKLAELYANQGLVVDARSQYLIVADAYTRVGNNKKALDTLHRIADLDPNNTEIRLKLADGYLKENMRGEAVGAFVQAANRLQQTAAHDRALDAYSKALSLIPDQRDALRGMLETNIVRGTPDDAAEVLEPVVKDNEKDHELVSMLARAYLEAEDPKGAERATSLLMAMDPANYPQFLPVAQLYLKTGEIDETVRILGTIIERMLQGREERDLLKLVNGVLEQNPDHVAGLRMLVRIHWWQRDMDSLRNVLERLAEAAEAAALVDDERYALTQLVRLAPDEQRYLERLNLLGGLQDETTEGSFIPTETGDVPQFETFGAVESRSNSDVAEVIEFETNAAPGTIVDPTSSFADLNETSDASGVESRSAQSFQEVDLGLKDSVEVVPESPADAESEASRVENSMRQELESVDFYITQGYSDIAIDTLDVLEKQFGPQPEIQKRREKLASASASAAQEDFEFGGADDLGAVHEETVSLEPGMAFASLASDDGSVKASGGKGIDSGLAELFEEFRVAEEEDSGHEDFETHYNMGTAYKEMELMDEAIQEFQTSVALVKADDGTPRFLQCCNMLGHCFVHKGMPEAAIMWFKKGLAAPGHSEDEYQALRYELGGAYEEMGDFDQALQCYTEVYGVDVNYREVGEKLRSLKQKQ
jgi:Putative Zn-dependent protease, contains TPR repeats